MQDHIGISWPVNRVSPWVLVAGYVLLVQVVNLQDPRGGAAGKKSKKKPLDGEEALSGVSLVWSNSDRGKGKQRSLKLALVQDIRRGHRTPVWRQQVGARACPGVVVVVVAAGADARAGEGAWCGSANTVGVGVSRHVALSHVLAKGLADEFDPCVSFCTLLHCIPDQCQVQGSPACRVPVFFRGDQGPKRGCGCK